MLSRRNTSTSLAVARLLLFVFFVFWGSATAAQQPDADSKTAPTETAKSGVPSLKDLPDKILTDQKFLWVRPFRPKRDDARWVAAILGASAGLIATDRRVGQELSESPPGGGYAFARRVGQAGSGFTDFGVAGAFYLVGRWRADEHARTTGVLGLEAVADTMIVVEILKAATQRPRPTRSGGRLPNHDADGEFFVGGNSFPSGHAAEAWAIATTVAEQYPGRRWVAPTAYGLAGLVSVSRIAQRRHFPSDVFVGSVLGYLIARHVSRPAGHEPSGPHHHTTLLPSLASSGGTGFTIAWQF